MFYKKSSVRMRATPLRTHVAHVCVCAALLLSVAAAPVHAQQKTVNVTDVAGRQVAVPVPVNKAVVAWSGSGGPFMTMSALIGKDVHKHIAGWGNDLAKYRKDMYDAFLKSVPELQNIPVVGSPDTGDFNVEKVIGLAPEVVIFPLGLKKAMDAGIEQKLQAAGIPVVYTDYHAETVENHRKTTLLLGQLFNKEARARQLADLYTNKRKDVEARVAKAKAAGRTPPRVYLEVGSKGPAAFGNTFGANYSWGGLVSVAGGDNVTASNIVNSAPVNPEFLLKTNPEVIVLAGSYWPKTPEALLMGYTATPQSVQKQLDTFAQRPGWSNFSAIKNKRLYTIHHGTGRELFDYASLAALGKAFYPQEFQDINPEAELKAYYRNYMPYDISGVWYYQWK